MRKLILISLAVLIGCGPAMRTTPGGTDTANGNAGNTNPPPPDQPNPPAPPTGPVNNNLTITKVRIYKLSFAGSPAFNSTFDNAKINEFIATLNQIYAQAGIKVELESVIPMTVPTSQIAAFTGSETGPTTSSKLAAITFPALPAGNMLQAAFFRNFPIPAKGLYIPRQKTAFIGEYAPNGTLNDGLVLAHEMGHELSLPHINQQGEPCPDENLMCIGGSGISDKLNATQIEAMRRQAALGPLTN